MKQIKNKSDLHARKMGLRIKELELEKLIRNDWTELKDKLQLKNMMKMATADNSNKDMADRHWLVNGLHIGASILTKKILSNTGQQIEGRVEGVVDNFLNRVQGLMDKRKNRKTKHS